jgi:hypothetical protein
MRKLAVAAVATAGLAVASCGGATKTVTVSQAPTTATGGTTATDGTTSTPSVTTTDTTGVNAPTTDTSSTSSIPSVHVGQTQTLSADNEGDQVAVAVTSVQRLAPDQFNTPDAGKHYDGVSLKLMNQGGATYSDSPGNIVTLILSDDSTVNSDLANVGGCSNNGDVKIGSGETIRTCVVFQVPNNRSVKAAEVSLDSGNSPPGEWTL